MNFEFGSVVLVLAFKKFLIWSYAILKEGIIKNIHVKLYERGTCIKRIFWPPMRSKNKSCSSQHSSY